MSVTRRSRQQRLGAQVRRACENGRDCQVQFAARKLVVQPVAFDRLKMQIEAGRVAAQPRNEGGQEAGLVEIDGRDPRDAGRLSRFERARQLEGAGDIGQDAVNRSGQFERPRRRLHASVAKLEEAVVEEMTQPVQGLAHRRLAEPVVTGGAGHIALRHQGVEREEKVQVDPANIPFGHSRHILFSFPQSGPNCHDPLRRSIRRR